MRRFEGHQQDETKPDNPIFTESAAVKVSYILLRLSTPSRHNRAILKLAGSLISENLAEAVVNCIANVVRPKAPVCGNERRSSDVVSHVFE